jgi:3alpha(or 20beta)-hydroxysteroid dehydrogenase
MKAKDPRGRLADKVVIVSGAARGVGESIARIFTAEGAKVLLSDIRDEEGEKVAADIRAQGGVAIYQHLDVRNRSEWDAALALAERELGPVNVLVNNAFKYSHPAVADLSVQEWQENLDINLTGGFHGIQTVLPGMRERKQGTIVVISSSNGPDISLPSQAAYQAAKAGLSALTRHTAVTYGGEGIRANAIHPGPIKGAMLEEVGFREMAEFVATGFPIQRMADPDEIAWAAVYLASDESSYVTAETLIVDGGSVATLNFPGRSEG